MPWKKGQSGNPMGPKVRFTREERREHVRRYKKKWVAANIERLREYNKLRQRIWGRANPERRSLIAKKSRLAHPEADRLRRKKWETKHPQYWRAQEQSQRDRMTSGYIAELLWLSPKELPPALIEAKRAQVRLIRELRRKS